MWHTIQLKIQYVARTLSLQLRGTMFAVNVPKEPAEITKHQVPWGRKPVSKLVRNSVAALRVSWRWKHLEESSGGVRMQQPQCWPQRPSQKPPALPPASSREASGSTVLVCHPTWVVLPKGNEQCSGKCAPQPSQLHISWLWEPSKPVYWGYF